MYLWVFPNRDYAIGATGGLAASACAIFVSHPVESLKVRMQSGHFGGGPGDSLLRRLGGLLWRPYYGIMPHLVQYSAFNSVRFGSFAAAKGHFQRRRGGHVGPLPLADIFLCGAFSGTCIAATLHPLFVLKTHQQVNRISLPEALGRLWHHEGVRGLFRGYLSGFARFPLALGVFFTMYEALSRPELLNLAAEPQHTTPGTVWPGWLGHCAMAGALSGIACWTSIYPLDVVQSRVMGEAAYGADRRYTGALTGFARLYQDGGPRAFLRSYSAVLVRSGPVNAVLLPASEAARPLVERLLPSE